MPLIAVPNTSLLHNHQVELAEEMARQGYIIHGHLKFVCHFFGICISDHNISDLPAALKESETLRKERQAWPPDNRGADPSGRGLAGVMDEEMGFYD